MKIYDKKGLWCGFGIIVLGAVFLIQDILSPSANPVQEKWNIVLSVIVIGFGITDCVRCLSKRKTHDEKIELMDERNRFVNVKSKAKALDILRGFFIAVVVLSVIALKKTGYMPFAGMLVMAGFSITVSYIIEMITGIYYEEKE